MARRFTRVFRGRTSSVRQNVWLAVQILHSTIAANTKVLLGSLTASALALRPFTIVRSHMLIQWVSDQAAATESAQAAMGQIVVNDQAVAVGATAIPDPLGNVDAPFFVWQPMDFTFRFVTAAGFESNAGWQYTIDSKAMRKVGNNEDIAMVIANVDSSEGGVFSAFGRFLIKLH